MTPNKPKKSELSESLNRNFPFLSLSEHKKDKPSLQNSPTDRFIPSRKQSNLEIAFTNAHEEQDENKNYLSESNNSTYQNIYRNVVLEKGNDHYDNFTFRNNNLLKFKDSSSPIKEDHEQKFPIGLFKKSSPSIMKSRKIPKNPYKVLDAPALQDDFYLNLIDWSEQNVLAVGLSSCVYLWSAQSSNVTKLCDFGLLDMATSVSWSAKGNLLAIGTNSGEVQLWDPEKMKRVHSQKYHSARVGISAWNGNLITSGSRDKSILIRDIRNNESAVKVLAGHKQEVCGLKWSFDGQMLASGGNDNKLFLWSANSKNPLAKFSHHSAAVKALAWSPHQHGLLASGGGTADRNIRFWNTNNFNLVDSIDTGSQVCNLMFSKNVNELVSTHGYSQNQIIVWKYPEMQKIASMTGHSYRVLFLAMNPDGQTIVTGAGDETLRFWNIFPSKTKVNSSLESQLLPINNTVR